MLVQCAECIREFEAPEGHIKYFCSIECACYHGWFNVKTGWKIPEEYKDNVGSYESPHGEKEITHRS
jgi:nitrite reductase/ring-hydroxylating ferredoxin subunit